MPTLQQKLTALENLHSFVTSEDVVWQVKAFSKVWCRKSSGIKSIQDCFSPDQSLLKKGADQFEAKIAAIFCQIINFAAKKSKESAKSRSGFSMDFYQALSNEDLFIHFFLDKNSSAYQGLLQLAKFKKREFQARVDPKLFLLQVDQPANTAELPPLAGAGAGAGAGVSAVAQAVAEKPEEPASVISSVVQAEMVLLAVRKLLERCAPSLHVLRSELNSLDQLIKAIELAKRDARSEEALFGNPIIANHYSGKIRDRFNALRQYEFEEGATKQQFLNHLLRVVQAERVKLQKEVVSVALSKKQIQTMVEALLYLANNVGTAIQSVNNRRLFKPVVNFYVGMFLSSAINALSFAIDGLDVSLGNYLIKGEDEGLAENELLTKLIFALNSQREKAFTQPSWALVWANNHYTSCCFSPRRNSSTKQVDGFDVLFVNSMHRENYLRKDLVSNMLEGLAKHDKSPLACDLSGYENKKSFQIHYQNPLCGKALSVTTAATRSQYDVVSCAYFAMLQATLLAVFSGKEVLSTFAGLKESASTVMLNYFKWMVQPLVEELHASNPRDEVAKVISRTRKLDSWKKSFQESLPDLPRLPNTAFFSVRDLQQDFGFYTCGLKLSAPA
jgi:hypothetical protein